MFYRYCRKAAALALALSGAAFGQTDMSVRTPLALSPGMPAGSYQLSGFDSVNLYSGNLSVHLPLHAIVGRGDAQYMMYLNVDRRFSVETDTLADTGNGVSYSYGVITNQRPDTYFSGKPLCHRCIVPGFFIRGVRHQAQHSHARTTR